MTRRHSLLIGLMLACATSALPLPAQSEPPAKTVLPPTAALSTPAKKAHVAADFGRLPLAFESNQGQTDARVRFLTHSDGSTLFLTPSEAVFSMANPPAVPHPETATYLKTHKAPNRPEKITRVALRMQIVGADPKASALQQPVSGRINYFYGNDPSQWHTGVPTFGRAGFHQVYPGIDLVYYGSQKHLEYDFNVAPHADPQQIKLHFAGAQSVRVNARGDLIVRTQGRELTWQKPIAYQQDATGKHPVNSHFRLKRLPNGQKFVSFALGRYDTDRPLVIDPVLLSSTYLGGSYIDYALSIAIDSAGNAYVTGHAGSADFPTTSGAFQPGKHGTETSVNLFVTKLNSTGTALIYSTYLGGSGYEEGYGIAVDSSGNAYVTGSTESADFPTTSGAFQRVRKFPSGGSNVFVTKLNPTGTALLYSTYLGGSGSQGNDRANKIAVDSNGNAYVAGFTSSADFPTTPGAFQPAKNGAANPNAFVAKFNSTGTALIYSTFLGGSGNVRGNGDFANGMAIDSSGSAYVTGYTTSADFPTTPGVFQRVKPTGTLSTTAFVTKLNSAGSALAYSTYLGGSGSDAAYDVAIDSSGSASVVGDAGSTDFPTTPGTFQRIKPGGTISANAFLTKLNSTGSALIYSTYLGGHGNEHAAGVAIDGAGDAYITGYTTSFDFPTTVGAFQRVKNAPSYYTNAFVTRLNSTGSALVYSTFLGGSGSEGYNPPAIVIDSNSNAYIAGSANSLDFPTTPDAIQRVNHSKGSPNSFVTKLAPVPIFPDFNNDGKKDILLQNATTGAIASWFMAGAQQLGSADFSLTPPGEYALIGAGDFNGDGNTTLVLQSSITHQIAFWYTSGTNHATIPAGHFVNATPDANYQVIGIGDFNGDGKSDLVFQNQTTNQIAIWFMNGYINTGGALLPFTPLADWKAVGVGDFNTDGFTDIVFQNQSTGQIALWYLNGTNYADGKVLSATPAPGWNVVGVGDYNGDGSADLLFQNQTGNQAAVWYLKNGGYLGGAILSLTPPIGWKIVGPR